MSRPHGRLSVECVFGSADGAAHLTFVDQQAVDVACPAARTGVFVHHLVAVDQQQVANLLQFFEQVAGVAEMRPAEPRATQVVGAFQNLFVEGLADRGEQRPGVFQFGNGRPWPVFPSRLLRNLWHGVGLQNVAFNGMTHVSHVFQDTSSEFRNHLQQISEVFHVA